MNIRKRFQNVILYGVFICYILFLFKLLLLSRASLVDLFNGQREVERSINLIPFYSIYEYIFSTTDNVRRFAFSNVVGNIIAFVPLGVYLSLFKNNKKIINNLLLIFMTSLIVEIIQGILGIGASDIDDLILNTFGGLIGILGYKFLGFLLREEKKVHFVITIISIMGLPVLLWLLFMVKLKL